MSLSVEHISAYFRAVGDEDEAEGDDSDGDENTGRSEEKELKKKVRGEEKDKRKHKADGSIIRQQVRRAVRAPPAGGIETQV